MPPDIGTPTNPRRRRTQKERRETTRAALLDATIASLVQYGYKGTTTARIVKRAGVSRGAQVHHFPTKDDLVGEAVRHLAARRVDELLTHGADLPPSGARRLQAVLDLFWRSHEGALFTAALELWVAARTDKSLRRAMGEVEQQVAAESMRAGRDLLPGYARKRTFDASFEAALATMRGLALLRMVEDEAQAERNWLQCRQRLMTLF